MNNKIFPNVYFASEPTIGDCWASAVAYYHDAEHLATIKPTPDWYPASIFFQGMKYMLYGDPVVRLPGPLQTADSVH